VRNMPRTRTANGPIRVTFVDQVGGTAGGAERTLATFLGSAPRDIEPSAVLFEDGAFACELRSLGVRVDVVPVSEKIDGATRESGTLEAAISAPPLVWRVGERIRAQRADVVYTNSMKAHIVGSLGARLARTPCVIHFHDLFEGGALRTLQTVTKLASQERIACSRLVASAMDVENTSVIYGPVELKAFRDLEDRVTARAKLGIPAGVPVVGLIGRINRWKGHDRFVRIAARVNADLPVHFAIVGAPVFRDADFVPELHQLVSKLGLRERVSFHPWLDDVRSAYAALDVNANCSTREPFGRTIVEAAAAGVPTVCFGDSGAAETIVDGQTGRTIPAGDEEAFARAIVQMLANRARIPAIRRAARAAADRFDAPLIAEEMATVIRRVAAAA